MATAGGLNARQRKQVYLHSAIFAEGGPDTQSVYSAERQGAVYQALEGNLRRNNLDAPEITLPKPEDMRITEYSGHQGIVFPHGTSGFPEQPRSLAAKTNAERLVHDGEIEQVVHSRGRDESIPREFWATSVNLQWHDTRHERCRSQVHDDDPRHGMGARERKQHQLSSEVLGHERLKGGPTAAARQDLFPDTCDQLQVDSRYVGSPHGEDHALYDHHGRAQHNLRCSGDAFPASSMEAAQLWQRGVPNEDPVHESRRRQEKNFSDLFETQMGSRQEVRGHREEMLAASGCRCMDSRSEIAVRNMGHWRDEAPATAEGRREAQITSHLFDHRAPPRVPLDPEYARDSELERAAWEAKDCMEIKVEVAHRRVAGDHRRDFDDPEHRTHQALKQELLASDQVRRNLGATPTPARCAPPSRDAGPPRCTTSGAPLADRSAKDTKLASLQSSIFG
mmetsp:Transcript_55251/g.160032  ORF Transcript_55251/g.160032 Transcript_55251/m.160032 type:complete len:451 (+) Transcript_55251:69-1421(+)